MVRIAVCNRSTVNCMCRAAARFCYVEVNRSVMTCSGPVTDDNLLLSTVLSTHPRIWYSVRAFIPAPAAQSRIVSTFPVLDIINAELLVVFSNSSGAAMDSTALAELLGVSPAELETAVYRPPVTDDNDLVRRLCIASEHGHVDLARLLILAGVTVNRHSTRGLTPLFIAASQGHEPMARLLLSHGAGPSEANTDGSARTPLYASAKRGDVDILERLLDASADVRGRARHRKASPTAPAQWLTPLEVASHHGQAAAAALLLERCGTQPVRAASEERGAEGSSSHQGSSHQGSSVGSHQDSTCGGDMLAYSASELVGALHCAAAAGDVACTRLLLTYGASVEGVAETDQRLIGGGVRVMRGPPLLSALLPTVESPAPPAALGCTPPAARSRRERPATIGETARRPPLPSSSLVASQLRVASALYEGGASPDATCLLTGSRSDLSRCDLSSCAMGSCDLGSQQARGALANASKFAGRVRSEGWSLLEAFCIGGALDAVQWLLSHDVTIPPSLSNAGTWMHAYNVQLNAPIECPY